MLRILLRIRDFLLEEKMPVWLSLLLVLGGGWATYYLAPAINEKFEMQVARREFLVKNLEQFSTDVKSLLDLVSKGVNAKNKNDLDSVIMEINPFVSKIQFSVTQMNFLLPRDAILLVQFQRSLEKLQTDLKGYTVGESSVEIIGDIKEVMILSMQVYRALLDRAGLSEVSKETTAAVGIEPRSCHKFA